MPCVGPSHGAVTAALLAAEPGLDLWCVEPDAAACAALRMRVAALGASDQVTVVPASVGEALERGWLPGGIGTVVLVGVVYFLSPAEHVALWAGLEPLLADDATVLMGPVLAEEDEPAPDPRPLRRIRERAQGHTTLEWWREDLPGGDLRHVFRTVLDGEVIEEAEGRHPAPRCGRDDILGAIPASLRLVREVGGYRYLSRA